MHEKIAYVGSLRQVRMRRFGKMAAEKRGGSMMAVEREQGSRDEEVLLEANSLAQLFVWHVIKNKLYNPQRHFKFYYAVYGRGKGVTPSSCAITLCMTVESSRLALHSSSRFVQQPS